jgi:protein TonB
MRKYTLLLSVTVHVVAACALIIAPLFAAASLPSVHDVISFVPVHVAAPPSPPPPPSGRRAATDPTHGAVTPTPAQPIPMTAPDGFKPETPVQFTGRAEFENSGGNGVPNGGGGEGGVLGGEFGAPPQPVIAKPTVPPPPLHVGGGVVPPRKTRDVSPVYPPIAVAAGKEGVVILEAVIAEDGSVREVKVLRSVTLLDQAAMDAVRQWRFTPTLLSGQPVPVVMTVTVNFKLN